MRVAALYDIHGNLPALEAVLAEIRGLRADRIVVGGDVVCGPMTLAALTCLLDLDISVDFIQGNAEAAVLTEMSGTPTPFPEQIREVIVWDAEQLRDHQPVLARWPKTLTLEIAGLGEVLFCHATPRDENEIVLRTTPEDVLVPIFDAAGVPLVVCGHTHMQFDRKIGRTRVVNAGSVGMPFQEPGAYWLLLEGGQAPPERAREGGNEDAPLQGSRVELKRTPYDLSRAAERIRASGYPQADQFAKGNVLRPPTEAAMLEMFATLEVK